MKVEENCMRNVSLGLVYLDWSSLLSIYIWLKYHQKKKTHLRNNSAHSVFDLKCHEEYYQHCVWLTVFYRFSHVMYLKLLIVHYLAYLKVNTTTKDFSTCQGPQITAMSSICSVLIPQNLTCTATKKAISSCSAPSMERTAQSVYIFTYYTNMDWL